MKEQGFCQEQGRQRIAVATTMVGEEVKIKEEEEKETEI